MDGFTKCGNRTYSISPSLSWLTLVGDTLTLESNTVSDAHTPETITLTVTLDSYPTITETVTFTIELICQVLSISITSPTYITYEIGDGLLLSSQILATQSPAAYATQSITYEV